MLSPDDIKVVASYIELLITIEQRLQNTYNKVHPEVT